ncbi:MAG: selenocysteine-specific translation elongation factor [Chloroflexi bacterium]|nr:selenocysteine-specific translation elongation factor [Chloroflexota bacterium]
MFVIGTAGHVDHGKSALVLALTGIDPDRLKEEKERGLTIDLGFAWLELPSGREVSIVDVPGHERFIRNMLAGVGGIDLALLVIAADEGVMPQTREHLAIIDLLRVEQGLVVVTKKDLVDDDWLDLVTSEIIDALKGTVLEKARIVSVSSVTGEGLPELLVALDDLLEEAVPRTANGRPRLPIDRAFTISGFGTVVTGTLMDGRLAVGEEVELVPGGARCRIRGLQTHKQKVEVGEPGSRVAANLAGITHDSISRGQVLTTRGWLKESIALDVWLRAIPGSPVVIKHNASVTFHLGTSETLARVRLLDTQELGPGDEGWAQMRLQDPVASVKGDLFVVRSHQGTLGGGEVIETHAKRHRRHHAGTIERLEVMAAGTPEEILVKALEASEPRSVKGLIEKSGVLADSAREAIGNLVERDGVIVLGKRQLTDGSFLYSLTGWGKVVKRCEEALEAYHRQYPLRPGAPREELRSRLGLSAQVFPKVMERLGEDGVLVEEGSLVRAPSHRRVLTEAQQKEVESYLRALESRPYSPPTDIPIGLELLSGLVEEGKVVRVSPDVVFSASAYKEMVDRIVQEIGARGKINVGQVRDMFDTSRKYALAFMEYLDQQKVTRRVGDDRVLR